MFDVDAAVAPIATHDDDATVGHEGHAARVLVGPHIDAGHARRAEARVGRAIGEDAEQADVAILAVIHGALGQDGAVRLDEQVLQTPPAQGGPR